MALDDAFETVADTDTWERAIGVLGGFLAPTVARNVIEPRMGYDAPDELYGVIVMLGGQQSPMYSNEITLGGSVYVADKLAERANVKQTVTSMGGN